MTDMPEWEDDDVIELTDIVEDDADAGDDGMIELTDIVEDDGDMSEPAEAPVLAQAAPEIRMEDLEAALERVIEAKFSDKIESILFEVMERVIEKEIAQIKESLQKDLDQIGNI